MAITAKYQMEKMFFTALYADRNDIPSDMKSKLMLSSMMPEQGMGGMLSSIVTIDQHKEVLDQKKTLEVQLKKRESEAKKITTADRFMVNWVKQTQLPENPEDRDELVKSVALFLASYIKEVHQTNSLPPSFAELPDIYKKEMEAGPLKALPA